MLKEFYTSLIEENITNIYNNFKSLKYYFSLRNDLFESAKIQEPQDASFGVMTYAVACQNIYRDLAEGKTHDVNEQLEELYYHTLYGKVGEDIQKIVNESNILTESYGFDDILRTHRSIAMRLHYNGAPSTYTKNVPKFCGNPVLLYVNDQQMSQKEETPIIFETATNQILMPSMNEINFLQESFSKIYVQWMVHKMKENGSYTSVSSNIYKPFTS